MQRQNEGRCTSDEVGEAAVAALRELAALDDVLRAERHLLRVVRLDSQTRLQHSGRRERVAAATRACIHFHTYCFGAFIYFLLH